jgi:hypothetical protein
MPQPSKACTECGTEFFKDPKLSNKQWSEYRLCSRRCRGIVQSRLRKGVGQSDATKALKSEKLKERWQKPEWREHMSAKMKGNQFAKGIN